MSDHDALEAFTGKWRARWPEWRIAETFVPAPERAVSVAWLALRQELADAAWAGADPRPGVAKLAWWSEELHGWMQGRRRHPLGLLLQRVAAPWDAVAAALPALAGARAAPLPAGDGSAALRASLAPFAGAAARVSAAIALATGPDADAEPAAIEAGLCAMRVLAGEDGSAAAAVALLGAWPARAGGTRADRLFAAVARLRLEALAGGAPPVPPPPVSPWRTLWATWRAGRTVPRA